MLQEQLEKAHRCLETGQTEQASVLFQQLQQDPGTRADALNGLGLCAEAAGQLPQAEAFYRRALGLKPDDLEYTNNLAIVLQKQGFAEQALPYFKRLTQLKPDLKSYFNLALVLASMQAYWETLEILRELISQYPRHSEPVFMLLEVIKALFFQPETLTQLQTLLARHPDQAAYHLALAAYYGLKDQDNMAIRYFRSSLRCNPALLGVYRLLIHQQQNQGNFTQALTMARQLFACEVTPESLVELMISLQDPVPASFAEVKQCRQELEELLQLSEQTSGAPSTLRDKDAYVPSTIPYFLIYQWGEDRPLQEKFANFFSRFLQRHRLDWQPNPQPRLGIFSIHLHAHSAMAVLQKGLETLLQSQRFETWIFLSPYRKPEKDDQVTLELCALADHVLELPRNFFEALHLISAQNLDLMLYLDIGMDALSYGLALNRLARYQLVLPGHPLTTGMRTIDFYISSEALESASGDSHYTESLIRLPRMPEYRHPEPPAAASREALGLPSGNLYFCPMALFKIQPAFDEVMAQILAQDPLGQILLLENKEQLHIKLRQRFTQRFPQFAGRLQFLPWSSQPVFFQRMRAVDVILDTFPFGGGNTSYQALSLGCPIVCLDVPWQKGRWTQAMYQLMGTRDLIACNTEHYVKLAIKVATDKIWQAQLRQTLLSQSEVLFEHSAWAEGLLDFCQKLVHA